MKHTIFTAALLSLFALAGCSAGGGAPRAEVYVDESALSDRAPSDTETPPAATTEEALTGAASTTESERSSILFREPQEDQADTASTAGQSSAAASTAISGTAVSAAAATAATGAAGSAGDSAKPVAHDDATVEILLLGDSQFANARTTETGIANLLRQEVGQPDGAECVIYDLGLNGSTATLQADEIDMAYDQWTSSSFLGMAHLLNGDVQDTFLEQRDPEVAAIYRKMDKSRLDYIVVNYGTNDFLNGTRLSNPDGESNLSDFTPAYEKALRLLRSACPQATVVCCSPCYSQFFARDGAFLGDGNTLNNGSGLLVDYVNAIDHCYRQIEDSIYVDMYHRERIDLDSYTADDYLSDGIHLTARGRRAWACAVGQLINKDRGAVTEEYRLVEIGSY